MRQPCRGNGAGAPVPTHSTLCQEEHVSETAQWVSLIPAAAVKSSNCCNHFPHGPLVGNWESLLGLFYLGKNALATKHWVQTGTCSKLDIKHCYAFMRNIEKKNMLVRGRKMREDILWKLGKWE